MFYNDKEFYMDEWYRWGSGTIDVAEEPVEGTEDEPYVFSGSAIEDFSADDGVAIEFDQGELDDDEFATVQELWDEDNWAAFDENEIYADDCEIHLYGPLEIKSVD